uniref:Uncharacterized protein n=1 Tax=uncultured bacterium Contig39 TaxID=1393565 RepID=W0FKI7_9BACT|nr:hypothetical protein [uncultured bacterium Contig39]
MKKINKENPSKVVITPRPSEGADETMTIRCDAPRAMPCPDMPAPEDLKREEKPRIKEEEKLPKLSHFDTPVKLKVKR